jgi:hypothetical protein
LRHLEEENRKLKQLVADLSLDKVVLQDVLQKSSRLGRTPLSISSRHHPTELVSFPSASTVREGQSHLVFSSSPRVWESAETTTILTRGKAEAIPSAEYAASCHGNGQRPGGWVQEKDLGGNVWMLRS